MTYGRGWFDLRRYNRISPEGHLNARLVYGTQLGGGALPLERRFSMGGPGSLPGYEFRQLLTPDVFTCSDVTVPSGQPAQCTRMLLAQVEYRADFTLRLFAARCGEGGGAGLPRPQDNVVGALHRRRARVGDGTDGGRRALRRVDAAAAVHVPHGRGGRLRSGLARACTRRSRSRDWQTIPLQFVVRLQHRF